MTLLEALQADTAEASTAILKHVLGNLVAPMRSRVVKQHPRSAK